MSVPHLDTRIIEGKKSLLFGPYAGFSSKVLKHGSLADLFESITPGNIMPMLGVARDTESGWLPKLKEIIPTFGIDLARDADACRKTRADTAAILDRIRDAAACLAG
jgi:Malate:quinone oxidoreductase (Mqo)